MCQPLSVLFFSYKRIYSQSDQSLSGEDVDMWEEEYTDTSFPTRSARRGYAVSL